jgi:hypothetical protein
LFTSAFADSQGKPILCYDEAHTSTKIAHLRH